MLENNPVFASFSFSDGRDGVSSCHQLDGSPAGMQLNHLCQGLLLLYLYWVIRELSNMESNTIIINSDS